MKNKTIFSVIKVNFGVFSLPVKLPPMFSIPCVKQILKTKVLNYSLAKMISVNKEKKTKTHFDKNAS